MTTAATPSFSLTRRQLLVEATHDIHSAMARAIPFILAHPEEASVLSDLGRIASASDRDLDVFRSVVGELIRTAVRADANRRSVPA